MMKTPLLVSHLFAYSQTYFPTKEIVSRTSNGVHRYTYAEFGKRTHRLSAALAALGVRPGDRVGTLAWNDHRHLEAYFAVPNMGAVLHTINIRLSSDQLSYIVNHAKDRVLLVDANLVHLLTPIRQQLTRVQAFVIFGGDASILDGPLQPAYSYEDLLTQANPNFSYPIELDENSPMGMCYTSATTGLPKGVVYSHRGIYLHSMAMGLANTAALSESDTVMPIVPMFHANAWGLPFAAIWFGAKVVLPGPAPSPGVLLDFIAEERVTLAAGVPTIWLGILKELETQPRHVALRMALCGGAAAPPALIQAYEEKHHIPFVHAYGMTETSPLALFSRLKSYQEKLPYPQKLNLRATQGLLVPGLEMRVANGNQDVAWDGTEMGELLLRGPWIADGYEDDERSKDTFIDGWLHTGDVATVNVRDS